MARAGQIRAGIGGWSYAPWRGSFYPPGLAHAKELHYASRALTAIEVNSTFYGPPGAASFARWREAVPAGPFVFALKAPRFATHRKRLAEAAEPIERFCASGIEHLGDRLGPILWQFAPTKRFEARELEDFLELLPRTLGGRRVRHALDARHPSFLTPEYFDLARAYGAAAVLTDAEDAAPFADATADFVYARLARSRATYKAGYAPRALDLWAERARIWARGGLPADLPCIGRAAPRKPRDVFLFVVSGAKERAPAAARALIERVAAPQD